VISEPVLVALHKLTFVDGPRCRINPILIQSTELNGEAHEKTANANKHNECFHITFHS
jgi:hypothetical protein